MMPLYHFGREMTADEKRERDARWEAEAAPIRERHQRLLDAAAGNPVALAVAELHRPSIHGPCRYCGGCDFQGYEAEPVEYPCRTIELLERHFGLVGETIAGEVVPEERWPIPGAAVPTGTPIYASPPGIVTRPQPQQYGGRIELPPSGPHLHFESKP